MGAIAARIADRVLVTSDNPRTEAPAAIAMAIAEGIRSDPAPRARWTIELDRRKAITEAVRAADIGDVVLVAGKGHETYQEQDGIRLPFSDVAVAGEALAAR
jgi:UDP-N-acetylmuramoyl-L-alanyl-D-glutamate--2,6-diaminopimelate ligase